MKPIKTSIIIISLALAYPTSSFSKDLSSEKDNIFKNYKLINETPFLNDGLTDVINISKLSKNTFLLINKRHGKGFLFDSKQKKITRVFDIGPIASYTLFNENLYVIGGKSIQGNSQTPANSISPTDKIWKIELPKETDNNKFILKEIKFSDPVNHFGLSSGLLGIDKNLFLIGGDQLFKLKIEDFNNNNQSLSREILKPVGIFNESLGSLTYLKAEKLLILTSLQSETIYSYDLDNGKINILTNELIDSDFDKFRKIHIDTLNINSDEYLVTYDPLNGYLRFYSYNSKFNALDLLVMEDLEDLATENYSESEFLLAGSNLLLVSNQKLYIHNVAGANFSEGNTVKIPRSLARKKFAFSEKLELLVAIGDNTISSYNFTTTSNIEEKSDNRSSTDYVKNPCNPCAAKNSDAPENPRNPCAAKNPANPDNLENLGSGNESHLLNIIDKKYGQFSRAFSDKNYEYFQAKEFFTLGNKKVESNFSLRSSSPENCVSSFPNKRYWCNIYKSANDLDLLRKHFSSAIRIESRYDTCNIGQNGNTFRIVSFSSKDNLKKKWDNTQDNELKSYFEGRLNFDNKGSSGSLQITSEKLWVYVGEQSYGKNDFMSDFFNVDGLDTFRNNIQSPNITMNLRASFPYSVGKGEDKKWFFSDRIAFLRKELGFKISGNQSIAKISYPDLKKIRYWAGGIVSSAVPSTTDGWLVVVASSTSYDEIKERFIELTSTHPSFTYSIYKNEIDGVFAIVVGDKSSQLDAKQLVFESDCSGLSNEPMMVLYSNENWKVIKSDMVSD